MINKFLKLFLVSFLVAASSLFANDEKLFKNILIENQKVNQFMLDTKKQVPDISSLDTSLNEYLTNAKKNKKSVKGLKKLLKKPSEDFNTFKKDFSAFSRQLSKVMKKYKVSKEYNRFYCPMTKGDWVSKGKKVKNPYAPKMRNCGSIKKS